MSSRGEITRGRILDSAQRLILDQGLAATSIDAILADSDTTKGAFFHHFPSKNHLARAVVERYARADLTWLEEVMDRAESRFEDPALQLIEFIRSFQESADETVAAQPSCLYVSYVFDRQLAADGTNDLIVEVVLAWRQRLAAKIDEAARAHPPAVPIDHEDLADLVFAVFEGAFIMARAMDDPSIMRSQLDLVRTYLVLVFGLAADS